MAHMSNSNVMENRAMLRMDIGVVVYRRCILGRMSLDHGSSGLRERMPYA